jgi:hypothetical protein
MIEFLDGAIAAYFSQMLNCKVIWSPAELAEKNLARKSQDANRNDLGLPGMAVYRTACAKYADKDFDQTLGSLGWPAGKTQAGDYAITKTVPVQAEYSIQVLTQHQSDLNCIERDLRFLTIGNPVYVKIRCKDNDGNDVEIPLQFAAELDDPIYTYVSEPQSGKLLQFGMQNKLYVDSFWTKSDVIPRIEQIDILYQSATNDEEPITYEQLDFVTIVPKDGE